MYLTIHRLRLPAPLAALSACVHAWGSLAGRVLYAVGRRAPCLLSAPEALAEAAVEGWARVGVWRLGRGLDGIGRAGSRE